MPRPRAPHTCNVVGCSNTAPAGQPNCPRHTTSRSGTPGYGNRRWRRASTEYLADHPVCQCPGCPHCSTTGCTRRSQHTDHIDGRGLDGPRAYDRTNFLALCHPCHSHKTATAPGAFGRTT